MNSISPSNQKHAIRQLIIDLGKTISNKQRQTLIEIYIALDNASRPHTPYSQKPANVNSASGVTYGR